MPRTIKNYKSTSTEDLWFKTYIKSLFAGIVLGIAGMAYLSALTMFEFSPVGKVIGACLFSFGLLVIRRREWSLYTGAIGILDLSNQAKKKRYFIPMLIGNLIGLWLASIYARNINPALVSTADILVTLKIAMPWYQILTASFACGVCMYLACTTSKDYMVAFPVIIFILCGFEHVLADFFYMCMCSTPIMFSLEGLKFLGIALIGATVGANIIRVIDGSVDENIIINLSW